MRGGKKSVGSIVGAASIGLGVLVILALVLPAGFWWLLLGIGLIAIGIFIIKRC